MNLTFARGKNLTLILQVLDTIFFIGLDLDEPSKIIFIPFLILIWVNLFKIGPSKTCGRLFKGWFPQILLGLFLNTLFLLRIIIWCCTCYYNVKLMMMTCFGRTVDLWKALYLIFIRDNCQRFSPWQTSDTPQAGFEPTQNLSSGFFWITDSARGDLFSFFSLPFRRFQVWLLSTGRLSFTSGKSLSSGLFIYLLIYLFVYSLTFLNLAYILVHIYIKKHD